MIEVHAGEAGSDGLSVMRYAEIASLSVACTESDTVWEVARVSPLLMVTLPVGAVVSKGPVWIWIDADMGALSSPLASALRPSVW